MAHSKADEADPGVTGALLPTLLHCGEKELATRSARWLLRVQRPDGAYPGFDQSGGIFKAGHVLRGLLAARELVPGTLEAAQHTADSVYRQMLEKAKGVVRPCADGWMREILSLSVLAPLYEAAKILQKAEYRAMVERYLQYNIVHQDTLGIALPNHLFGYQLDMLHALIDLDRADLARPLLDRFRERQAEDGSVLDRSGVAVLSFPSLAHLALCWYKLGQWESADKALAWLERKQRQSTGFLGHYHAWRTQFVPLVELIWAIKWYLDAHHLRVCSFMERYGLLSEVSLGDGRVQALARLIQPGNRVIEVGCGKGRFLKAIRQVSPTVHCTGVDIVPTFLAELPSDIQGLEGALESVPCPDNSFDVVFSNEAVEHSINVEAAVRELCRIARPGGWVVIIDKQWSQWGRFECPSWERWPEAKDLTKLLKRHCNHVTYQPVRYSDTPADGLILAWFGQKLQV